MDALIASILQTNTDDLLALLQPIDAWRLPRSDLNAWIRVHNKFDAILGGAEEVLADLGVRQAMARFPNAKL